MSTPLHTLGSTLQLSLPPPPHPTPTPTPALARRVSWRALHTQTPTPYTLHPTPYSLHPTPYTIHPTPKPYTLHPTPYTLHPIPYILHPTPYTLPRASRPSSRPLPPQGHQTLSLGTLVLGTPADPSGSSHHPRVTSPYITCALHTQNLCTLFATFLPPPSHAPATPPANSIDDTFIIQY